MPGSFEDLKIWQKAHELMLEVYRITKNFPQTEQYGLTSQLRRAALSVPANIAEAHGRYHYKDAINFLLNARGSAQEVRNFLLAARDISEIKLDERVANPMNDSYQILIKGINSFIKLLREKAG